MNNHFLANFHFPLYKVGKFLSSFRNEKVKYYSCKVFEMLYIIYYSNLYITYGGKRKLASEMG
jgi:hypothetical protein